eukprot:5891528-Pleurochrysis_carterae.AAC.1
MRALLAARSSAMRRFALSEGLPSRHWSSCDGPMAPAKPNSPARVASSAAALRRRACLSSVSAGWLPCPESWPADAPVPLSVLPLATPTRSPRTSIGGPLGALSAFSSSGVRVCAASRPTVEWYHALPCVRAHPTSESSGTSPRSSRPPAAPGRGGGAWAPGYRVWGEMGGLAHSRVTPRRPSRSSVSAPPIRIAPRNASQHAAGMRARLVRQPAAA